MPFLFSRKCEMNGTNFLADTNALIYLLNGNQCMSNYLQKNLYVSVISEMELLSYSGITPDEEMQIKSFLNDCNEVTLTNEIKDKTIEIRKKYKTKLPDAIIAASAIVKNIPLITADKGFCQISNLTLELIVPVM